MTACLRSPLYLPTRQSLRLSVIYSSLRLIILCFYAVHVYETHVQKQTPTVNISSLSPKGGSRNNWRGRPVPQHENLTGLWLVPKNPTTVVREVTDSRLGMRRDEVGSQRPNDRIGPITPRPSPPPSAKFSTPNGQRWPTN